MKHQKFNLLAAFALLLTVSLALAGCGGTANTPVANTPVTGTTPAASTPMMGATDTPAMAGTPMTAATATTATSSGNGVLVGLVTDVGKVDDKSFNQSAWEGVQAAAKANGYQAQYIETNDPKDYATNIQKFVDQKYNIIVTVGFLLADDTAKAAAANPNIQFVGVDQFIDTTKQYPKNYTGLIFNEDQSGYLAGALAAYMSKTASIGAVLGTDNVPPVWRFGEGYRAGALSVNPKIQVTTIYHEDNNAFNDPDWGSKTASSLVNDKNADVIFGAGGKTGNGALVGVAKMTGKTVYAIGVDTDQYDTVPEAQKVLLSSATKGLKDGTSDLVTMAANGKTPGGNYYGKSGLAPFHDLDSAVPADVKTKLDKLAQDLASGAVKTNVPPVKPSGGTAAGGNVLVGLVTDVGKVDDKSFNQSAWEGVQAAAKANGYQAQYIETNDPKDYATNIQKFVDQKYNVIVTVGFLLADDTMKAAQANPNIQFIGVDQFIDTSKDYPKNYTGLIFNEDQSGYLAGALAAYMSKTASIGAVLGTDNVPPVWRFGEGYRAGALSVNPKIQITIIYHEDNNAFNDPDWGSKTASSLVNDKNADVIFGAGGKTGNGALVGVAKMTGKTVYAIGVDTDQYDTVPEAQKVLLSSATKGLKDGTSDLVTMAAGGKAPGGNFYGKSGLAPFHDLDSIVPADVKTKLDKLAQDLASGAVKTDVPPVKPSK